MTLVGKRIMKKRQLRDKQHAEGLVYDFDVESHEHLVVYSPGEPEEDFEWFNVLEMSDKQGLVVGGDPIPHASLPKTHCGARL